MQNPRYTKCEHIGGCYLLKVSSSWERLPVSGSVAKLQHFVTLRRFTYDVIGQWPDPIWKWKHFVISGLNGVSVMPSFSSPSQTNRMLRLVNHGSITHANATAFCKMAHNFLGAPMRTFKLYTRLGIIIGYTLVNVIFVIHGHFPIQWYQFH